MVNFWEISETILLENSSKRKHSVENNISRIPGRHTGRFTGKLIQTIFQSFFNFLNLFKLRQKKPLFLEEKQVYDET